MNACYYIELLVCHDPGTPRFRSQFMTPNESAPFSEVLAVRVDGEPVTTTTEQDEALLGLLTQMKTNDEKRNNAGI